MNTLLNPRAAELVDDLDDYSDELRIECREVADGCTLYDFGIEAEGSLDAGLILADICMAGLGEVDITPGEIAGVPWPHVSVRTDHPVAACLLSQYAGWQISTGKFFAMGSGPMRAAAAVEELFDKLDYRETVHQAVGVLETGQAPTAEVFEYIRDKVKKPQQLTLCAAPTASVAGNLQVVARSVETALHKLFELGFDVKRIAAGFGTAPLAPVAADDLSGIGLTNDAILYGGRVTLWVHGDDETLAEIGPKVPAGASQSYGRPFLEIFREAGGDFYQLDPLLFSPAEIVFQNLDSGRVHHFGRTAPDVLKQSFGL